MSVKNVPVKTLQKQRGLNVETFPFIPVSIFLLVALFFWKKIADQIRQWLNPDNYETQVAEPISKKNEVYKTSKSISKTGKFINGVGTVTNYSVSQASAHAEELSAIFGTEKSSSWYTKLLAYTWSTNTARLKVILNGNNFPASYRRYVIEAYRDIYTDKRSLANDTRAMYDGLVFGSGIPVEVNKYFTL